MAHIRFFSRSIAVLVRAAAQQIHTTPLFAAGLLLSACTLGPKYAGPPEQQLQALHNAPLVEQRSAITPPPALDYWWRGFNDAQLDTVIERALNQNLDLAA